MAENERSDFDKAVDDLTDLLVRRVLEGWAIAAYPEKYSEEWVRLRPQVEERVRKHMGGENA